MPEPVDHPAPSSVAGRLARLAGRALRTIALFSLAGGLLAGCRTKSSLRVTSDPPGALVRLDDREVGVTPTRVRFDYYGTRRVTLYRDGYRTHSEQIELRPPWYERFPIDFFSELLLPFGWRDTRALHVVLEEGDEEMTQPELRSVFERSDILRRAGPEGPRDLPQPVVRTLPEVEEEPGTVEEPFQEGSGGDGKAP